MHRKFKQLFDKHPLLIRSAGRVNFLGEHANFNSGLTLTAAINRDIMVAIAPNQDSVCNLHSFDRVESFSFSLDKFEKNHKSWTNYVMAVIQEFQKAGFEVKGFDAVFGGQLPIGVGLASSAALEAAFAFAINHIFNLNIDNITLAKIAQKAEEHFIGIECDIMDQFTCMLAKQKQAIKLDCLSLDHQYVPCQIKGYSFVICNSKVSRTHSVQDYQSRREQCKQGIEIINQDELFVNSIRDISPEMLYQHKRKLDPIVYKRCHFVIHENIRVEKAVHFLEVGNWKAFGEILYQSHYGLRDEYEMSCPELDFLVALTESNEQVLGARMTGGGFGGCTINIVKTDSLESFATNMKEAYLEEFDRVLDVFAVDLADGVSLIL